MDFDAEIINIISLCNNYAAKIMLISHKTKYFA